MTVQTIRIDEDGIHEYSGLSTDTKPLYSAVPPGSTFWETNTGNVYVASDAGWKVRRSSVSSTSMPSGDEFTFNAVAPARTGGGNPTFTGYAIKNATGFRLFEISVPKLPTDEYLVAAWSITANDETALGLLIDAYCDEIESGIATLKAGVLSTNIDKCTLAGETMTHVWDGTTTIKTILSVAVKLGSTIPTGNVFYGCRVVM